jgi:glyoxylase-like metal-dependent hydrolase (beta-lactamase superfamily II)
MTQRDELSVEITGTHQREAWLAKQLPSVEQLRTDLWSIPIPMPNNPLRYVSVYVLGGESGLTLVDAGWDSDEAWAALTDGLAGIGASVEDVRGSLVTHMHFDHIGLARRLREASGAWIALHPADRDVIADPDQRDAARAAELDRRWLFSLGASADELDRLAARRSTPDPRGTIAIPDRLVEDGENLELPGWSLRAVHTPGHTPGHLCFTDERSGLLFGGDHLLPRISPNISAYRETSADALGDFLASLTKVADYPATEVLPAHEWRYRGLRARVEQLLAHHEARLSELLAVVRDNPASAPWQLAGELTWSRPWDQYDDYMRISAVGETAAHLVHLARRGLVSSSREAVPRYTATPARPT